MKVQIIGYDGNEHKVVGELRLRGDKIVYAINPEFPVRDARELLKSVIAEPVNVFGRIVTAAEPELFLSVLAFKYSGSYFRATFAKGARKPMGARRAKQRRSSGICPKCKSGLAVPIVYGLPTPEALKAAAEGEIVMGGRVMSDDDLRWECSACRHRWR